LFYFYFRYDIITKFDNEKSVWMVQVSAFVRMETPSHNT